MAEELISVVIPVYNVAPYLRECLDTVIRQTYKNLDIVIVDDGSTDGGGAICDEYAKMDGRIKVIHQTNQGLVAARKAGAKAAAGTYIGFVDSDDWIDLDMYENLIAIMRRADAELVSCGRYIEDKNGADILHDLIGEGTYSPLTSEYFCRHMIYNEEEDLWGVTPNFWNKLFIREKLVKFQEKLDNRITYGEDDACVYPYILSCSKIVVVEKPMYHYRMRPSSMSHSGDERYFEKINLLYLCMKDAFISHPLHKILRRELDTYMFEFTMRGIGWLWGINPRIRIPMETFDLEKAGIKPYDKLVLYGAGEVGQDYYTQLCILGFKNNITWVDKDYRHYVNVLDLPVQDSMKCDYSAHDKILIATKKDSIAESIKKDLAVLNKTGIPVMWIKPDRIFRAWIRK